mmetsp:Transcript_104963/g.185423  ORF Transcript_104963/g.185423 Transcript_104963/m.185423 type:complete len:166 (+) Transcript_104963:1251-1748(+)
MLKAPTGTAIASSSTTTGHAKRCICLPNRDQHVRLHSLRSTVLTDVRTSEVELEFRWRQQQQQQHPCVLRPQNLLPPKKLGQLSSMTGVSVNAAATAIATVTVAQTPMDEMKTTGKHSIIKKHSSKVTPDTSTMRPDVFKAIATASAGLTPLSTSSLKRVRRNSE